MTARFGVVATDLDRTFTREDLTVDDGALRAVAELRRAGVLTVLATGRTEAEVAERGLGGAFDAYVLESGARVGRWGALADAPFPQAGLQAFLRDLEVRGIEAWRGPCSASIARKDLPVVARLAARAGIAAWPNRDRVDLVPAGVDKGVGLALALALLAPGRHPRVLAIGDGENDAALLRAAGHGVAVANAAPELKAVAHEVAPFPAAAGFAWAVRERVLA